MPLWQYIPINIEALKMMLQYRIAPPKLFPFFLSACPYKEVTGSMETFHRLGLIDWHGLIVHSEPLAWLKWFHMWASTEQYLVKDQTQKHSNRDKTFIHSRVCVCARECVIWGKCLHVHDRLLPVLQVYQVKERIPCWLFLENKKVWQFQFSKLTWPELPLL